MDSFSNFIINVPSHDEEHISPLSSKEKCNADLRRFDTLLDMEIGTEAFCTSVDFDRNTRNMTEHFVNAYMLDETPLAPERTNSQNSGIYDRVDVVNPHNRGIDLLPLHPARKASEQGSMAPVQLPQNLLGTIRPLRRPSPIAPLPVAPYQCAHPQWMLAKTQKTNTTSRIFSHEATESESLIPEKSSSSKESLSDRMPNQPTREKSASKR